MQKKIVPFLLNIIVAIVLAAVLYQCGKVNHLYMKDLQC